MRSFFQWARDPVSCFTHFLGALFSLAALVFFLCAGLLSGQEPLLFVACLLFGLSLLALYSASSLYHYYNGGCSAVQVRLRKLDHSMIYILIAGTYTPIAAAFLPPERAWLFLAGIWAAAGVGILVKLCWLNAPRWLYTAIYLLMGWAIVFDWRSFAAMPMGCLGLIIAGGVCYTAGALFYALKRPNPRPGFGFHEIFHLFILGGSLFHFLAVALFLL